MAQESDIRYDRVQMGLLLLFEDDGDALTLKVRPIHPQGVELEEMETKPFELGGRQVRMGGPDGSCRVCPDGTIVCGNMPCPKS